MRRVSLSLVLIILLAAPAAEAKETLGPLKGTLILGGGGGHPSHQHRILSKFVELAGGTKARVVVVPTAITSSRTYDYSRDGTARRLRSHHQVRQVTIVHTHDRTVADSKAFVRPIAQATGVWFSGGRQWRFTKAYHGTRAERAFHDVLNRGGVIAGSSAGATIQGSFLARGDTRNNTTMIGNVQHGFGFLQNAAIDQHIVPRGRQLDMIRLLEDPTRRMMPEFDRASLLGLGIDEDTAIVVRGNSFEVIGKPDGLVFVYNPRTWTAKTPDLRKFITLPHGARYDLKRRQPLEAAIDKPSGAQASQ